MKSYCMSRVCYATGLAEFCEQDQRKFQYVMDTYHGDDPFDVADEIEPSVIEVRIGGLLGISNILGVRQAVEWIAGRTCEQIRAEREVVRFLLLYGSCC